ncbi:hypothetical protein GOODEAATRI_004126 [Goodea atripinnis]|uniref:Sfi1 spindle body domain-containing protein n=1 Tax=Goodea atripinnis TaxID=208336 RepID=A0ABV0MGW6_9TELE
MHNTFGRVLPLDARCHYSRGVLRRAFERWRDDWWTSRREWSLMMRAECHYRVMFCVLLEAMAQRACRLRLVRKCLSEWRKALSHKQKEERRLRAADHLAVQSTRRRALGRWRVCILSCTQNQDSETHIQQRQFTWVFYTWWGRSEKHKEQKLFERMVRQLQVETSLMLIQTGCCAPDTSLCVSRRFSTRSNAAYREPGCGGDDGHSSRSERRRNRTLHTICTLTGFSTTR